MRHIIEGVRPYAGAQGRAGKGYMSCIGEAMNVLAFQCPLFEDARIFNLLKVGWSAWYSPRTGEIFHAYVRNRFFYNLKILFNLQVETICCRGLSGLRNLLRRRIYDDHPLFLWINGMPILRGEEISFIGGSSSHMTFVCYGIDDNRDSVLLLNNHSGILGWAPMEVIGKRLDQNIVYDIPILSDCTVPIKSTVNNLLLEKVRSNFRTFSFFYGIERYLLRTFQNKAKRTYKDLPRIGMICGPEGIRTFADKIQSWNSEFDEAVQNVARRTCRQIMLLREEREIFFSILDNLPSYQDEEISFQTILSYSKELSKSWKVIAKLMSKIYMAAGGYAIAEIQERLYQVANQEVQILKMLRDFLKHKSLDKQPIW